MDYVANDVQTIQTFQTNHCERRKELVGRYSFIRHEDYHSRSSYVIVVFVAVDFLI